MRNIHAYDYEHVDLKLKWTTLTKRIHELREKLIILLVQ